MVATEPKISIPIHHLTICYLSISSKLNSNKFKLKSKVMKLTLTNSQHIMVQDVKNQY